MEQEPLHLMLVEDDPTDVALTRAGLKESKLKLRMTVVADGAEALRRLQGGADGVVDLVILDLNLPGLHGLELLRLMREDERLRDIPVCVVTVSDRPEDEKRAKELGATCFVTKPLDFDQFIAIVQRFDPFYLSIVRSAQEPPKPPEPPRT